MKKLAFFASFRVLAVVALSSVALAQHKMQPEGQGDQTKLVQIVRNATKQYLDVNNATAAGYGPFLGCVTGQDHGAMGVHYVNGTLLSSGEINASRPQALIYEPEEGGKMQLVDDQKAQVENLKSALRNLDQKLAEANVKADLLIAQHRRARVANRAADAQSGMSTSSKSGTFDRMKRKVAREEAISGAKAQLLADDVEYRLAALEKEDRIEQLLVELKTKRGA